MGSWWKALIAWRRRSSESEWAAAPVTRTTAPPPVVLRSPEPDERCPLPSYEDFVLSRRRLPTEPRRALEVARRAAVADPEVRERVLGTEAARLALCEAVELAVLVRIAEGRTRWVSGRS